VIDANDGAFGRHDAMPAVATGAMCMQSVELNTIMGDNQINFICKSIHLQSQRRRWRVRPAAISGSTCFPRDYPLG
jgi:hypothetical protein